MIADMEITFDPAKDAANIRTRGIPLAFGAVVIANAIGQVEYGRFDYGENRLKAFAQIEGVLVRVHLHDAG
jgi:uncharacterized DUF497 family protein